MLGDQNVQLVSPSSPRQQVLPHLSFANEETEAQRLSDSPSAWCPETPSGLLLQGLSPSPTLLHLLNVQQCWLLGRVAGPGGRVSASLLQDRQPPTACTFVN